MTAKMFAYSVSALLTVISLFLAPPVVAAGNSISLSPSSTTVYDGNTVSLTVLASTADPTNAVQANVSYPANKLQFLSTSYATSAFEVQAESTGGSGSIQIARGTLNAVTGTKTIAVISFRALVSSGSATVSLSSGTALANDGNALSIGTGGTTVNFAKAPPAAPKPPAPIADTTPPTISGVTVTAAQTSAVVAWKTDKPSDSTISYGLTTSYGLSVTSGAHVTAHTLTLSSAFMEPNTTYHYQITSIDGGGNKRVDSDRTFTTAPVFVHVRVTNSRGVAESGVVVVMDGQTAATSSSGIATFKVGEGIHTIQVNGQKTTSAKSVNVAASSVGAQPVNVNFSLAGQTTPTVPSYISWILVLLLGIVTGNLLSQRRRVPLLIYSATHKLPWPIPHIKVSTVQKLFGSDNPEHNPYKRSVIPPLAAMRKKRNKNGS